jgi:hypothetical protein
MRRLYGFNFQQHVFIIRLPRWLPEGRRQHAKVSSRCTPLLLLPLTESLTDTATCCQGLAMQEIGIRYEVVFVQICMTKPMPIPKPDEGAAKTTPAVSRLTCLQKLLQRKSDLGRIVKHAFLKESSCAF